ncbi:MAG: hypothetical protein NZP72_11160, partial [Geminicoccaceae bacterium]|nr:hypothetical protein [Geminicoccaceae bacterium]
RLAKALHEFGADLETLRTGDLLLGKPNEKPSAVALVAAIEGARSDVEAHLPPLSDVLDRMANMVRPLATRPEHLASPGGLEAVAALARLYARFGRWLEAAATLREGWVNLFAAPEAARPGAEEFDQAAREAAEESASAGEVATNPFRAFADLRNDLLHAQYRPRASARPVDAIRKGLGRFLDEFEQRIRQRKEGGSR